MNEHVEKFSEHQLAVLRRALNCSILTDQDPEYDQVRRIWNGMIDRKPSVIVRPTTISDVMQTVRIARDFELPVCVRGGGHSVAGKSVANGATMIDLSLMNGIQVTPGAHSAVAQGGAKWGEFDRECERYQLATTGGVISSTGVCGLTLGGGMGWLMGKHGLSCDNVISADLVSADGSHLSVSASQNEDLFWAIRGGGGNFGIVTALEFRLHSLKSVQGGLLLYPRSSAFDLLRRYRDVTRNAPDELTAYAALMIGHGQPMVAIAMCDSGSHVEGVNVSKQFYLAESPVADMTGEKKYTEVQSMLDFTAPAGLHYYFKCPFLSELSDDAIRTILEYTESLPSEQTQVVLEHMHGAASRVPVSETAFGLRRVHYSINIITAWSDPALAEKCIDWAHGLASALEAFGASDAYVNYLGDEGLSAVRASYGVNYERLAQLKKKYDPDNFFHFNQNIVPAT
ncbi:FAD-binding oxidoreductase [Acidicapsa ligni]|uniref:FAD-binding oxidoreductase n=1 Tax=Acidicapsa ligni TaxID=542300 RepID=UPI0021DF905F|nr:FAD-binding oxidoreductase [Acidicapsa ligni]